MAEQGNTSEQGAGPVAEGTGVARKMKAVVIDDDQSARTFLSTVLARRGYQVTAFERAADSRLIQCMQGSCSNMEHCPDVIICDNHLPTMSGVEFVETLLGNGCSCRHIALVTGRDLDEADMIRVARYGTRFFTKPLELVHLHDWLSRVEAETLVAV